MQNVAENKKWPNEGKKSELDKAQARTRHLRVWSFSSAIHRVRAESRDLLQSGRIGVTEYFIIPICCVLLESPDCSLMLPKLDSSWS